LSEADSEDVANRTIFGQNVEFTTPGAPDSCPALFDPTGNISARAPLNFAWSAMSGTTRYDIAIYKNIWADSNSLVDNGSPFISQFSSSKVYAKDTEYVWGIKVCKDSACLNTSWCRPNSFIIGDQKSGECGNQLKIGTKKTRPNTLEPIYAIASSDKNWQTAPANELDTFIDLNVSDYAVYLQAEGTNDFYESTAKGTDKIPYNSAGNNTFILRAYPVMSHNIVMGESSNLLPNIIPDSAVDFNPLNTQNVSKFETSFNPANFAFGAYQSFIWPPLWYGIAIERPFGLEDVSVDSKFFKTPSLGADGAVRIQLTGESGYGSISINKFKEVKTWQTIVNSYFNKGCLAERGSQSFIFNIGSKCRMKIISNINDRSADVVMDCAWTKCCFQAEDPNANKVCYTPEAAKELAKIMLASGQGKLECVDGDEEIYKGELLPVKVIIETPNFDECQYPGNLNLQWKIEPDGAITSGYEAIEYNNYQSFLSIYNDSSCAGNPLVTYEANNQRSQNIAIRRNPLNSQELSYGTYYAKVKVMLADKEQYSQCQPFTLNFKLIPKIIQPKKEDKIDNSIPVKLRLRGMLLQTQKDDGIEAPLTSDWAWYDLSKDPNLMLLGEQEQSGDKKIILDYKYFDFHNKLKVKLCFPDGCCSPFDASSKSDAEYILPGLNDDSFGF